MLVLDILAVIGAYAAGSLAWMLVEHLWHGRIPFSGLLLRRKASEPAQPEPDASPVAVITGEEFALCHAWAQMNPWYAADPALNIEAQHVHMAVRRLQPELSLEANLAVVTQEMHRRHPEIVPTRQ